MRSGRPRDELQVGVRVDPRAGLRAVLMRAAAACGLCAVAACGTAPDLTALVGLHDQALSLGRPAQAEGAAAIEVSAEPDVSDILRRR